MNGRYLTHIISHLLAYLTSEKQPYFSKDTHEMKALKGKKGHKVNPDYLEELMRRKAYNEHIIEHQMLYKKFRYNG